MNDCTADEASPIGIAGVERDTGIGKDTLRVWERRYGFPRPERDASGDRLYPPDQVERLRRIKRLLDAGHRPSRIVQMPIDALDALARRDSRPPEDGAALASAAASAPYLALLRRHDADALHRQLSRDLLRHGLAGFVNTVVGPLNGAVGDAWMRGELQVFEEHLYTEVVQRVLRAAIAAIPPGDDGAARPRALLTTVPQEPHTLGLLMAEAMLTLEGCHCVQLGAQIPLVDMVRAVQAHGSDVLVLSFSALLPAAQVIDALTELRRRLPAEIALWAGGSSPALDRAPDGVGVARRLTDLQLAVAGWRTGRQEPPGLVAPG